MKNTSTASWSAASHCSTLSRDILVLVILVICTAPIWVDSVVADAPKTSANRAYPLPPAWLTDQTLYEVNLRQFSERGDVEGLRVQLPRLKQLGIGIVWVMPIHPIGEKGRSGRLGSPYAVRDFKGFNSEFGTVEQFKLMIDEAHRMGLHVIIDWVAGHTALDHPWIDQHPDWYKHDEKGNLVHPQPTWKDVVALNYDSPALRKEMLDAMVYWVQEVGVDGFRCDSAEYVPLDFWEQARDTLRKIKPVFLLGEGVAPKLTEYAFDASYAWHLPPNMEQIVSGKKSVTDLVNYINADARDLSHGGFRLNFTSNHDKNAWEGTTKELLGDGVRAFTVLTFTLPGMPLIFNGQEAGVERRLNFFDHDPIKWRDDPMARLFRDLCNLRRQHRSLWCSAAPAKILEKSTTPNVLTFRRETKGDVVIVMLNLSDHPQNVSLPEGVASMQLDIGSITRAPKDGPLSLEPWGYCVWTSR